MRHRVSSVFLAREFGVRVWATDLWVPATANWRRVVEAGVEDLVFPVHAYADQLPYADGFFDVVVSIDAYHYFGVSDTYLGYLSRFVRPGGVVGVVVPGTSGKTPRRSQPSSRPSGGDDCGR